MGEMRVIGTEGDTKVIWDTRNEIEIDAARKQFDSLVEKGFTAYRVDKDGDKDGKMKSFDKTAGKIILVPAIAGG